MAGRITSRNSEFPGIRVGYKYPSPHESLLHGDDDEDEDRYSVLTYETCRRAQVFV